MPLPNVNSDNNSKIDLKNMNRKKDRSKQHVYINIYVLSPFPNTVTTRIFTVLVSDPYKSSFASITGKGANPNHDYNLHLNNNL